MASFDRPNVSKAPSIFDNASIFLGSIFKASSKHLTASLFLPSFAWLNPISI